MMAATVKRAADTVVDDLIRVWRMARRSSDTAALGWPEDSILSRVAEMGPDAVAGSRGRKPAPVTDVVTDADRVQRVVDRMPPEVKAAFEGYHVGVIRSESCRGWPQRARALMLGISADTYYRRVAHGREILRVWAEILTSVS